MAVSKSYFKSPLGYIEIISSNDALVSANFCDGEIRKTDNENLLPEINEIARLQLEEYFQGKRKEFDLLLYPEGTDFQKRVWEKLCKIPFGKTKSYGELARELGSEKLTRAVGSANGDNPLAIIVPCHRIIGSNGQLVGYAGGLWRKKWLLDFESKAKQLQFQF